MSQKLLTTLVKHNGLLTTKLKVPIYDNFSLSLVYTPGVGACCKEIERDYNNVLKYTNKANSIAMVTDGSSYPFFNRKDWHHNASLPQLEE